MIVLTEDGKIVFEVERTRTVTLNFPDAMIAVRTGSPRAPAACCKSVLLEKVSSGFFWGKTYTDKSNVLDCDHFERGSRETRYGVYILEDDLNCKPLF